MTDTTKKIDWKKIWSFIKGKVFIALVIVGLIAFSAMQCSRIKELKREKNISDQNAIAMKDSLKFERKHSGELLVSIAGYIATEKELKTLNKDLWERVKGIEGDVISLNRVILQLQQDSAMLHKALNEKEKIIAKLLKIDDNTYMAEWTLPFKYDSTNFDVFTGKTYIAITNKDPLELAHVDTELTKRLTQIDLTWGQTVEKGKLRIFIESKYLGFTVKSMEGVLIDPSTNPLIKKLMKEKHWFQGFSVGPSVTTGYNITTGKYALVLGAGLHYSIYQW